MEVAQEVALAGAGEQLKPRTSSAVVREVALVGAEDLKPWPCLDEVLGVVQAAAVPRSRPLGSAWKELDRTRMLQELTRTMTAWNPTILRPWMQSSGGPLLQTPARAARSATAPELSKCGLQC